MRLIPWIALLILSSLAACTTTRYEYDPPTTEQGRACVVQCSAIRETCVGNEIQRGASEKQICEQRNNAVYSACLGKGSSKEQEKECARKRSTCFDHSNTQRCIKNYNDCYLTCGGRVKEITEQFKF